MLTESLLILCSHAVQVLLIYRSVDTTDIDYTEALFAGIFVDLHTTVRHQIAMIFA